MTVMQVATYLRCDPSTIYRLLCQRETPAFVWVRIGDFGLRTLTPGSKSGAHSQPATPRASLRMAGPQEVNEMPNERLKVLLTQVEHGWIAQCLQADLIGLGDTIESAVSNLARAMAVQIAQDGTHGFRPLNSRPPAHKT